MHAEPTFHDNLLLAALTPADRAAVQRHLVPVDLEVGTPLYEPGAPIEAAWFLARGIVSMVSDMDQGRVEVGTIGREGMLGIPLLLHSTTTTTRAFMQVAGHGWRCPAASLVSATQEVPAFSRLLYRYIQVLFEQVAQSVACNRLHSLEERCARWLLMVHDRVGDEELLLKQRFLADMLGVHRPAVTLAAGALQSAGLIQYSRGRVSILDRAGLEQASCACYDIVRERFARLRDPAAGAPPTGADGRWV